MQQPMLSVKSIRVLILEVRRKSVSHQNPIVLRYAQQRCIKGGTPCPCLFNYREPVTERCEQPDGASIEGAEQTKLNTTVTKIKTVKQSLSPKS